MSKLEQTALDQAYITQFNNSFKMLIVGFEGANDRVEALKRFKISLSNHRDAYQAALAALDEM